MNADLDALLRILQRRRSIRTFQNTPIPRDVLDGVLEAAVTAPTAGNRQQLRLYVVTSRDVISAMASAVRAEVAEARRTTPDGAAAYLDSFTRFAGAPTVIVPIYRGGADLLGGAGETLAAASALSSVSAVVMQLLLAAHAHGLGACWMTGPLLAARQLEALLEVPRGWSISALIPLGFPGETPPAPPRRSMSQLVRWVGTEE